MKPITFFVLHRLSQKLLPGDKFAQTLSEMFCTDSLRNVLHRLSQKCFAQTLSEIIAWSFFAHTLSSLRLSQKLLPGDEFAYGVANNLILITHLYNKNRINVFLVIGLLINDINDLSIFP